MIGSSSTEKTVDYQGKPVKIIDTVPTMSDAEQDKTKKRIGNDLYEIFLKIKDELENT